MTPSSGMELSQLLILGACLLGLSGVGGSSVNDCRGVQYAYQERGLDFNSVPRQPTQGLHLTVCPRGLTCCTQDMESKLWSSAKESYKRSMQTAASPVQKLFGNRANKFNEFFTDLLAESKSKFHTLFQRTYGIIYERHADVFIEFFRNLEQYYERGDVNLEEALQEFFSKLYQRMFIVYNSQYTFDYIYLGCVSETMKKLQPFGDVPKKLTEQLRRSFVATRTFAQALLEGKKVMNKVLKNDPSTSCTNGLAKMTSCAPCQGLPQTAPCPDYCLNVMRGCLAYHHELVASWDEFIEQLQVLSERLVGPFNIEEVVDPIGVKISEAIMNFQNAGYDVTTKVFQDCGQGQRQKRQVQYGHAYNARPLDHPAFTSHVQEETKLNQLIKEIRSSLDDAKGFWSRLPNELCEDPLVGSGRDTNPSQCWNGKEAGQYTPALVPEGLANQDRNPEVTIDISRPDVAINEQILMLRLMTRRIEQAINGQKVDLPPTGGYDQADDSNTMANRHHYEVEKDGSGGGCDPHNDDEDCYDYYYEGSGGGSGSGDYEYYPVPGQETKPTVDGKTEDSWPPWLSSKPKSGGEDIEIESKSSGASNKEATKSGQVPKGNRNTKVTSGGANLHALKGLFYYLLPLMTCWLGTSVFSW